MRVAVIGAGASGLACARRLTDTSVSHDCVVYEQSDTIGGTWVYTDNVGDDQYGLPIHTSMYKSLRTNLPKEVMGYPDFPITNHEKSYIPGKDVLQFLNDFADQFQLRDHIQLRTQVKCVAPKDNSWEVTVMDVKTKKQKVEQFDAIMVCNGHYWKSFIPEIPGALEFSGVQTHSHDYRTPEAFRGQKVIVVGAGPSGMDITLEISSVAEQVIMSHHFKEKIATIFPKNVIQKPSIASFTKHAAIFSDGSEVIVDRVLYCTGFQYSFPFLSDDCNVTVVENMVKPLYKHLIHVDLPSLCFVGLPFYVCAFQLFDLQARFFLETLSGRLLLPSREEMLQETEKEIADRKKEGLGPRQMHMLGPRQKQYFEELSSMANIRNMPPVLVKLFDESSQKFLDDLVHYRSNVYRVLNDEEYVQLK